MHNNKEETNFPYIQRFLPRSQDHKREAFSQDKTQ